MKIRINLGGFCGAEEGGEVVERGSAHARNATKVCKKCFAGGFTDAINGGEFRLGEVRRAFVAVEGDAEAVGLIADMAHNLQRLAIPIEVIRQGVVGEENLLKPLRQAHNGHSVVDAELLHNRHSRRELSLAAIDNNQVGELFALRQHARVATSDNFPHRCKVIGAHNGLQWRR